MEKKYISEFFSPKKKKKSGFGFTVSVKHPILPVFTFIIHCINLHSSSLTQASKTSHRKAKILPLPSPPKPWATHTWVPWALEEEEDGLKG